MSRLPTFRLLLLTAALFATASLASAASGGPDAFGYSWRDNASGCSVGAGTFTGAAQSFPATTALQGPFNLGFTMPFYGAPESQVWVSPHGYVSFSNQGNSGNVQVLPDGGAPNHLIAAHWINADNADITVEASGGEFHVRWLQRSDFRTHTTDLFLSVDGSFRMRWQIAFSEARLIGHENAGGTVGNTLLQRDDVSIIIRDGGVFPQLVGTQSACFRPPTLLDCAAAEALPCNGNVAGTLPGPDPSPAGVYNCTPDALLATERMYRLDVATVSRVVVSIDNPTLEFMRIDSDDCREAGCLGLAVGGSFDFPLLFPGPYYFSVDDQAPGAAGFTISTTCEDPFVDVSCGDSVPGDTSGSINALSTYACAAATLDGPEALYRLNVPADGPVAATLATANPDLWVVIMDTTLTQCLAAGRGGAGLPFATAGDYAVLIDGENGAGAAFTLDITCGIQLDCSTAPDVNCAQSYSGDTSASPAGAAVYACSSQTLGGREDVYRFFNPVEQTVAARFLSSQPGQRLLLLDSCSEGSCLLVSEESVSCALFPAGEYFLVVDSPAGSEGPYEFEVNCSQFVTGVDLRVTELDTSALSGSCLDFAVLGDVLVTVSNLGTGTAVAPFDVVVFEDDPMAVNGQYDPASDQILGLVTVMTDIGPGQTSVVPVPSVGTLQFRDNVIYALADPDGVVPGELVYENNQFDTGRACEFRPPVGLFTPTVEWQWVSSTVFPDYLSVDTIPLVGDVNADGIPDVVFTSGQRPGGFGEGVVRVLNGSNGAEIWTSTDAQTRVMASSNLAIADIDGVPGLEIIAQSATDTATLVAIDRDGSFLWRSQPLVDQPAPPAPGGGVGGGGAPSIADLDCDGIAEIIYGKNVFSSLDGSYFWQPAAGGTNGINAGGDASLSVVVDVDLDGTMEVVAGPTAYKWNAATGMGEILWNNPAVPDGWAAVGNFDGDAFPEIAITAQGSIYLLEGDTGELIWQRQIPRGGGGCFVNDLTGGPPTVADFDGDCAAEVGVAGADLYSVLETDGTVRWSSPINDCSSHRTASSVFDFDGDGAAEVAFMDQTFLHVFQGIDGTEITTMPTASHTWIEMISIADVDADNNAEIIMPLNGSMNGIQVIGDADDNWVNTRRIWNQHAYHIDNVNDDGSIPPLPTGFDCEKESWLQHNTYRDQIGTAVFSSSDITISIIEIELIPAADCFADLRIVARIGNGGAINVGSGFNAVFYQDDADDPTDPLVPIISQPIPDIGPGEFRDFPLVIASPRRGRVRITAVADDDGSGTFSGAINECREDNNSCEIFFQNDIGGAIDPPLPVGWVLRVGNHGDPHAADITADFDWSMDEGAPRPANNFYRVYRGLDDPEMLVSVAPSDLAATIWADSTPSSPTLPAVHFYRIVAVDDCDKEAPGDYDTSAP